MKIGIVGARLAGSYASLLLSRMGHDVLLLDDSIATEKPCGGGVTGKALSRISWFRQHALPHTEIRIMRICTQCGTSAKLVLNHPLHIFSRSKLDSSLRDAACKAGTRFLPERALNLNRQDGSWVIKTNQGFHEFEFLVGADGANSMVRSVVAEKFAAADLSLALGFYVPGLYHPNTIVTEFQERGFQGYLWSFPRLDHASVGILRWLPATNTMDLRERVLRFISANYPDAGPDKCFYAARIPCLTLRSLTRQKVCGPGWALLGDAAGFTDAITSEGIYYALRSAELLADAIQRGEPFDYDGKWRRDFGPDLQRAAEWRDRFYGGTFLFQAFTRRATQLMRSSTMVRRLTDTLISGQTTYTQLLRHLILSSPRILIEAAFDNLRRSWPVPLTPGKA